MPTEIVEQKLTDILLDPQHFYLLLGIIAIIYMLSKITPIANVLFDTKWQWVIAPINLALSFLGIFAMNLTPATEAKTKLCIALVISMFATAAWEWVIKYIEKFIQSKFGGGLPTPNPPVTGGGSSALPGG